ncbi:hypothetical protein [Acinetobacter sp.]|uniref:hypothetical protein n=1 Tax=Acinetobacter sp. TaxID=472 RepID=UPI002FCB470E
MVKETVFCLLLAGGACRAMASYPVRELEHLDDSALRMVSGQAGSAAASPDSAPPVQVQDQIRQISGQEAGGGISALTQAFRTDERGEIWLEIRRGVVSIGVLEFSLSVDGLRQMGEALAKEITAY